MATVPVAPNGKTTTAAVAKGDTVDVTVSIGTWGARYIRVSASQAPDGGDEHEISLNGGPTIDISGSSTTAYQWSANNNRIPEPYFPSTITLTSGKAGTVFTVEWAVI
ncbi:MAG: hypothetical protein ACPGQD_01260 [Planctomycetota bacterium]